MRWAIRREAGTLLFTAAYRPDDPARFHRDRLRSAFLPIAVGKQFSGPNVRSPVAALSELDSRIEFDDELAPDPGDARSLCGSALLLSAEAAS